MRDASNGLEFRQPPLTEVVLGVQFPSAPGYQQIRAVEVWSLFRDKFPKVQELAALQPMFETFGLPQMQTINFGVINGALPIRHWFLSPDENELIQFQSDRLLHNWRKTKSTDEYPRYNQLISKFEIEINQLSDYISKCFSGTLDVNQCELSYINHIRSKTKDIDVSDWLRVFDPSSPPPDEFMFRRIMLDEDGKPSARLICEAGTAIDHQGCQMVILTLTVRGRPASPDIQNVLEFFHKAHKMIVETFEGITTEQAHLVWERGL